MKEALRFILLVLHIILSGVILDYVGDYVSHPTNILITIAAGVVFIGIILSLIWHTAIFVYSLINSKNKTTQL